MSAEDTSVNSSAVTTNPKESVSLENSPEEQILMNDIELSVKDEFLQMLIDKLDEFEKASKEFMMITTVGVSKLTMPAETPDEYVEEFKDLVSKVITHNISVCNTLGCTKSLIKQLKENLITGLQDKGWLIFLIIGLFGASLSEAATQEDSCYRSSPLDNAGIKFEDYSRMKPNKACGELNSREFDIVFNPLSFKTHTLDPKTSLKGQVGFNQFLTKHLGEAMKDKNVRMLEALLQPGITAINKEFSQIKNDLSSFAVEFDNIGAIRANYSLLINGQNKILEGKMAQNIKKPPTLVSELYQEHMESLRNSKSKGNQLVPSEHAKSQGAVAITEEQTLAILSEQGYGPTMEIYTDAFDHALECQITLLGCRYDQGYMKCKIRIQGGMMHNGNIFELLNNFQEKLINHEQAIPNFVALQDYPQQAFDVLADYAGTEGKTSLVLALKIANFQERLKYLGFSVNKMDTLYSSLQTSMQNGLLLDPNLVKTLQNDVLVKINNKFLIDVFNGDIYFPELTKQLTMGKGISSFVIEKSNPTYTGALTEYFKKFGDAVLQKDVQDIFTKGRDIALGNVNLILDRTEVSTNLYINSAYNTVDDVPKVWDTVRGDFVYKIEQSANYGFYLAILFAIGCASFVYLIPILRGIDSSGDIAERMVDRSERVAKKAVRATIGVVADSIDYGKERFFTSGDPRTLTLTNPPSQQTQGNTGTLAIDNGQGNVDRDVQEQPRQPISIANAKASIMNGSRNVFFKNSIPTDTSIGNTTGRLSIAKSANPDKGIIVGDIIVGTGRNIQKYDGPFFGGARTRRHKKRKGASKHYGKRRRGTRKCSKKRRGTRRKRR